MAKIISVYNNKGGVGKTTTTKMLAKYLAGKEREVLLIDNDPQGNLSGQFTIDEEKNYSVHDILVEGVNVNEAIQNTQLANIQIIKARLNHQNTNNDLILQGVSRIPALAMKQAISNIQGEYDYILIDCPPTLDLLPTNALAVSDEVIVPITTDRYSLEGLGMLLQKIEEVKTNFNETLKIPKIFINMHRRSNVHNEFEKQLKELIGDYAADNKVGTYAVVNESTFDENENKLQNHQVKKQFEEIFKELRLEEQ